MPEFEGAAGAMMGFSTPWMSPNMAPIIRRNEYIVIICGGFSGSTVKEN